MTHGCPGRANAGTESQLTIPSAWESQGALAGLTRRSPYKTFQKKQRCTPSRTHQARGFCTSAGLLCRPEVRARGGPTLLGTWGLGTNCSGDFLNHVHSTIFSYAAAGTITWATSHPAGGGVAVSGGNEHSTPRKRFPRTPDSGP